MSTNGLSNNQIIEFQKIINNQIKNARSNSKHNRCLLCAKQGGFCASHTVPQFCLKNIAWNGKLNSFRSLLDTDLLPGEFGIKNAGTFHIICRECDSKVFQDYENPEAYVSTPTENMLNQIALKNSLRDIYKHETELHLYQNLKEMAHEKNPSLSVLTDSLFDNMIYARKRDIEECYGILNKSKSFINYRKSWLRIISFDILDYVLPIAFQGMIALTTGVNKEIINNHFEYRNDYEIEYLHLAVFPLKNSSVVLLFLDKNYKRYQQFETFLKNSSLEEKLTVINRIIFLYTEDYFLSKQLSNEVTKKLESPAKTLQDSFSFNECQSIKNAIKDYNLRNDMCIPNLFEKKFAVTS